MFVPFKIELSVLESIRKAVRDAYEEQGYTPNEVLIHPATAAKLGDEVPPIYTREFVSITLGGTRYMIRIRVREDLKDKFNLKEDEGLLDVCDSNEQKEVL